MIYIYPTVFHKVSEVVNVHYPDLACVSQGKDYLQAYQNASECLSLHIYGMIKEGYDLPTPSRLEDIKLGENEAFALIKVDLDGFKPDWELEE
ncbi:MAG: type II toxin-antitoxin system HicB family antitoxin [Selenomonadaceae bacterium]|nr:type II toxin-antitoxin system HicB family antitoxin [Selenomonadaceae bacterium]MBQ9497113.1 type II toxin-antitoxin system HicB family antitoxin [Selenomonadaceae bacterium]